MSVTESFSALLFIRMKSLQFWYWKQDFWLCEKLQVNEKERLFLFHLFLKSI
ncbi:hypothetical protein LEP1GSC021_2771 [Leptospira noguchii str. 1993005606]|uniref:Uncharacterized protein n=5 Tax=Leptospira noguchii TaxID=28182 RepID=T0FMM8_9LEPT|nr:hypothetical protein LEP1GSC021_2771 [Leptospira noguchii str. 1993005606]EQA71434.1 hypothetical protein LEP1GSC059_3015 [Leptospira noguchii serovar Panama str. CZ214]